MQSKNPSQEDNLGFLKSHKVESESFLLSSGDRILVSKYFLTFDLWQGLSIPNTYNGKTILNWNNEPVFAELAILRLFQSHGWNGVWVDSYRRKFRVGLPDVVDPISIPQEQDGLIKTIRIKTKRSGGCWDVFVWKDSQVLFIELKRKGKDRIQNSQNEWLEASLSSGLNIKNFLLVEWDIK